MTDEEVEMGAPAVAWHSGAYVIVNALLAVVFVLNKGRVATRDINGIFDYWPVWIHVGWGAILLWHVLRARRANAP